jgi:DNA-binding LacI/PurR family transcriptional regulator
LLLFPKEALSAYSSLMNDRPLPTTAVISAFAGVSKSTASRALNNDPRISAKTRARVWSIAEELGYAPNEIAQALVQTEFMVEPRDQAVAFL